MNMSKPLQALILAMAALMQPWLVAADDLPDNAPIGANEQELLQWADTHNPELAAMRYEIDAANERIAPAGALPDPMPRTLLARLGLPALGWSLRQVHFPASQPAAASVPATPEPAGTTPAPGASAPPLAP